MRTRFLSVLLLFLVSAGNVLGTYYTRPRVVLETNYGDITIELFPDAAPITVDNFLQYVNSDFYDGSSFHRIVYGFVIQGGIGEPNDLRGTIQNEPGLSNVRGTIAMAKGSTPDSANSQFFVNLDDANSAHLDTLNGGFTVFGKVVIGMNVVDTIAGTSTDSNEKPIEDVNIFKAYLVNCTDYMLGDLDKNCKMDFIDFAMMSDGWMAGDVNEESHRASSLQIVDGSKDLSGDILVWQDDRNGNDDIFSYNISTDTELSISTDTNDQQWPAISGDVVVFRDEHGNDDIYGYDISLDKTFTISGNPGLPEREPAISGNIVVWRDWRNYHTMVDGVKLITDIYGADISNPNEPNVFFICKAVRGQWEPSIDGNIVVWSDNRNGTDEIHEYDIYGADISNHDEPNEFAVCTAIGDQINPVISGNFVIWQDLRYGDTSIFGYEISTGTEFEITDGNVGDYDISGSIVVWQDQRNGQWDIYAADVSDPNNIIEFPVSIADGDQIAPVISGSTIGWLDFRSLPNDLYWRHVCDEHLAGDFNGNCQVDYNDLVKLADNWLESTL